MGDYNAGGEKKQGLGYLDQSGAGYDTIGNIGRENLGYYGVDNDAYRTQEQGIANQLLRNPTSQDRAQYLSGANGGAIGAYQAGRARLLQDSANRGLDTANDQGSQSSTLGGGLATLGNGLASTQAGNEANYYNQYLSPNALLQRQQQAADITGGLADKEYGRGTNLTLEAAQGRRGLGSDFLAQSQRDYARADQNNPWRAVAGAAQTGASIWSMAHGGQGMSTNAATGYGEGGPGYGVNSGGDTPIGALDNTAPPTPPPYGGYGYNNPLLSGYDANGNTIQNAYGGGYYGRG